MKIQPQSGLGDLIFAFPLIESFVQRGEKITVATKHGYALEHYPRELVEIEPMEETDRTPPLKAGFTLLRYTRYGAHYFDNYFHNKTTENLAKSILLARMRLRRFVIPTIPLGGMTNAFSPYVIYAPPRVANRHKKKQAFHCAPDSFYADTQVKMKNKSVVLVGKDEIFAPGVDLMNYQINLINCLNFYGLVEVFMSAECVISQISAITALAGLLDKSIDFLPAKTESMERHAQHVAGVVWPSNEVLVS